MNATMTNSLVPNTTVPTELQKQEDLDDDSSTSSNSSSSSSSSTSSNDDDDDYDESISYDDDDDDDDEDATPAASTKAVVAAVKRPKKLIGTIPSDIRRSAAKLYGFKPPCGIDNDDSDDDDDDSSDDGDNMLSRAMQGLRRTSLENGVDLDPHHHHDNDCSDSNGTDYGYDDDCGFVAEEDQPKVHYRRRNSCLIQEGQDPFSAAAAQDSLLGGDGPPLMSDRDLEFEQERKAELVIAMYNQ